MDVKLDHTPPGGPAHHTIEVNGRTYKCPFTEKDGRKNVVVGFLGQRPTHITQAMAVHSITHLVSTYGSVHSSRGMNMPLLLAFCHLNKLPHRVLHAQECSMIQLLEEDGSLIGYSDLDIDPEKA